MSLFFDDVEIGDELVLGSFTFSTEEIIQFATQYDPQPFHLSEAEAAKTHFKRLCASGWHTAAIYMKLLVSKNQQLIEERRASGEPVAEFGPSPGFDGLKWLKPVYAGDTITYKRIVTGKTESRSRPRWGLIHAENHGQNQKGEAVFFFKSTVFVERANRSEATTGHLGG
ncbi:acyl dehydratase [Roseibium hamelinense]|uniref:Acyl dehydratase n=1 Tax=Roseibium hamelinense TaxID=150831 RepID=A0A562SZ90_9HYPH|nr:MaoC family dehydratase [Roseibium hamelinense]MTI43610.1 MaoC family dehydratase [Roseibium hamelinense]TWI86126.1 acyl dehydratase [Roseibium hamelinense]